MQKMIMAALMAAGFVFFVPSAGAQPAQQPPPANLPLEETRQPQPRLHIEDNQFEAGDVPAGQVVSHSFVVRNEGQAPLEISEVRSGCGCSVASFDQIIAPGASGKVVISIHVYPEWAGQDFRKAAWVLSNDPLAPQTRLIMSGRAITP